MQTGGVTVSAIITSSLPHLRSSMGYAPTHVAVHPNHPTSRPSRLPSTCSSSNSTPLAEPAERCEQARSKSAGTPDQSGASDVTPSRADPASNRGLHMHSLYRHRRSGKRKTSQEAQIARQTSRSHGRPTRRLGDAPHPATESGTWVDRKGGRRACLLRAQRAQRAEPGVPHALWGRASAVSQNGFISGGTRRLPGLDTRWGALDASQGRPCLLGRQPRTGGSPREASTTTSLRS